MSSQQLLWVSPRLTMASQTGCNDAGGFGQGISSELRSRDLPSKRLLGKGLASIGYETEWNGVRFARKDFVGVPSDIFRSEAALLVDLKDIHQNVVKTHGLTVDKLSCSLVLEYMDDKLSGLLQKRKERKRSPAATDSGNQSELSRTLPFELPEALDLMLQISKGMEYLHDQKILHGDLKTRNILVTYNMNDGDENLLSVKSVKVADFGLVQTKRKSMSYVSPQARKLDMVRWKAPENLEMLLSEATSSESDSNLDEKCTGSPGVTHRLLLSADVYSFAVTCFHILTGEEPYPKRNWKELVIEIVSDELRPKLPAACPPLLRDLLVSCWGKDPAQRPSFYDICTTLEHLHTPQTLQEIVKEQRELNAQREHLEEDLSSLKPMESVEPISKVSEALRIIEDGTETSSKFLMNKHQCEGLENRLYDIGEKLKELPKDFVGSTSSDAGNKMDYPAFDVLLTVLRKAKALLSKYRESKEGIPSVLTRTENRETFEEIHAELDMLNSQFHIEDFEYTSESKRRDILMADADEDLKEISENFHELATDEPTQAAVMAVLPTNLGKLKFEDSEKIESTATNDDLPSFLNIDQAMVEIKDPVRIPQRLSDHDPVEMDGWALVRFGRYLDCEYAIKVFKSGNTTWNRSELLKEASSLMKLHHPHIVQVMGFAQDAEQCMIPMELMDTDLRHFMKPRSGNGRRPFTRTEEMDIITQIAKGMYYLHEQQYVHGELKCSNILVKQTGDHIDVKISDLRSSLKLGVWDPVVFKERSMRRRPRWTAPEAVKNYSFGEPTNELLKKSDVYGFGMVCYEVVTGNLPIQDVKGDALKEQIEKGELKQELPGELDDKLRGLIESCWERDPNDRPTFEEICHLLDIMRSSQPTATNISSEEDYVLRVLKWIPKFSRELGATEEKSDLPTTSTWGQTNVEDGVQPVDSAWVDANASTLLDFVKIDPANLKKGPLIGKESYAEVYEATWLGCNCGALKELVESIGGLGSLKHLNLEGCDTLKELPESIGRLRSLQHLNLKYCRALKELPKNIGGLESLQHFNLEWCGALMELPESIGGLGSLQHFNLERCDALKELPESIGRLGSLQHLNLERCSALKELPESIGRLGSLQYLNLKYCRALKELPESIGGLGSLQHLNLKYCHVLKELPESIGRLGSLQHLNLQGCDTLKELPESIGGLGSLQYLNLGWCDTLKELPESIGGLGSLQHLNLKYCRALKELPKNIGGLESLQHFNLEWCGALMELPESIGGLRSLQHFNLERCNALKELPESIGGLGSLQHLNLERCNALKELPKSIGRLGSLQHLNLGCCALKELPENIGGLGSLQHLNLKYCRALKELPESIGRLGSLQHLNLQGCDILKELPESIGGLGSLQHLNLERCNALKELPESIGRLGSLQHLNLERCRALKELPESIGRLGSLQYLNLECCALKELPENIGRLGSLQHVNLKYCRALKELPESIRRLGSLQHLNLQGCDTLKELPESIGGLGSLQHFNLQECDTLKELPENIGGLGSLQYLNLAWCRALKELPENIGGLGFLQHLNLKYCRALKELPESIGRLGSLQDLNLQGCDTLKELPESIGGLGSLQRLNLQGCDTLKELPESIGGLGSLQHLNLQRCNALKELPESIRRLKSFDASIL